MVTWYHATSLQLPLIRTVLYGTIETVLQVYNQCIQSMVRLYPMGCNQRVIQKVSGYDLCAYDFKNHLQRGDN